MNRAALQIPDDTAARVHILAEPLAGGFRHVVVLARPPLEPHPSAILTRKCVSALLTHDAGVTMPNAAGAMLAAEVLQAGGAVLLAFSCLGDALSCHRGLVPEHKA